MIQYTAVVTKICADFTTDTPQSPHTFMQLYATAKDIVISDTSDLRLASKLLVVLARTYALYFGMLKILEMSRERNFPEISGYVHDCIASSCCMAKLFGSLYSEPADIDAYAAERNLALSESESLMHKARELRFSAVDRHKRIFAALPELEVIFACTELLKKSKDLCRALDDMGTPEPKISPCK